jgi:hypothetical protein
VIPRDAGHERVYRRLLRLYPGEFRARFSDEMVQLFSDQLRDARTGGAPGGAARTWLRTLGDLAVTAASEHARRDRTVAHSLTTSPSTSSRVLGLVGILGGAVLLAAFLPFIPWGSDLFNLWLVLFNAGAIAIVFAVHRRQAVIWRRLSLAAAVPAILANAWYLVMVILSIGRPQFPEPDPEFRPIFFYAALAMWLTDSAFGFVIWRIGAIARWVGLALAIGSLLAILGMDRFVQGDFAWFFSPVALAGVGVNGLAWILLGLAVATRRRASDARPQEDRPGA